MAHSVALEKGEGLGRGERYIVVDGVRWGRTVVSHHGVHGTKHLFRQEGGELLIANPDERYPREIAVRSERKRYSNAATWRPTESLVLEKAVELVATCRLRHPDNVREEQRRASEAYHAKAAKAEAKEQREFEAKAEEALDRTRGLNLTTQVKIIVEAMRWAQQK